jgi:hypothetical protein
MIKVPQIFPARQDDEPVHSKLGQLPNLFPLQPVIVP